MAEGVWCCHLVLSFTLVGFEMHVPCSLFQKVLAQMMACCDVLGWLCLSSTALIVLLLCDKFPGYGVTDVCSGITQTQQLTLFRGEQVLTGLTIQI